MPPSETMEICFSLSRVPFLWRTLAATGEEEGGKEEEEGDCYGKERRRGGR